MYKGYHSLSQCSCSWTFHINGIAQSEVSPLHSIWSFKAFLRSKCQYCISFYSECYLDCTTDIYFRISLAWQKAKAVLQSPPTWGIMFQNPQWMPETTQTIPRSIEHCSTMTWSPCWLLMNEWHRQLYVLQRNAIYIHGKISPLLRRAQFQTSGWFMSGFCLAQPGLMWSSGEWISR